MKNPHPPLMLIPARIHVFYSQSMTHPKPPTGASSQQHAAGLRNSHWTRAGGGWQTHPSLCCEAALSNECSVGLDHRQQGRTNTRRWVSLGKGERVLHWFSLSRRKSDWGHESHELVDQLAMKCDGECSLSWFVGMWQPLATLSLPECNLLVSKKIPFFMQMPTDPAAQHGENPVTLPCPLPCAHCKRRYGHYLKHFFGRCHRKCQYSQVDRFLY